jgi:hypothetical protein
VLVIIKLDFHNESNVIFQEKSNIALILPKWLCVKNVSQGKQQDMYISNDPQFSSIVSFKNGLRLHPIGTFDALLPEEWYSIFFFLSIDKLFAEYVARLRENNFSAVHSFIVRIFTALGPKDFPLRLRLRPAVEP